MLPHDLWRNKIFRGRKISHILFKNGVELRGRLLRCLVTRIEPSMITENTQALFFVSVSRTVRLAVERNRIKRFIRESIRRNQDLLSIYNTELTKQIAMLFIYYRSKTSTQPLPSFCEIDDDIKNILKNASKKYFDTVR